MKRKQTLYELEMDLKTTLIKIKKLLSNENTTIKERDELLDFKIKIINDLKRLSVECKYNLMDESIINKKNFTLDKIGKVFGISRERVRQIEKDAMRKIYFIMHKENFYSNYVI